MARLIFTHQKYECPAGHASRVLVENAEVFNDRPCRETGCKLKATFGGRARTVAADALLTVVYVDAKGNHHMPSSPSDPVPKGFARVELKTRRQIDRFTKNLDAKSRQVFEQHEAKRVAERNSRRRASVSRLKEVYDRARPEWKPFVGEALSRLDRPDYGRNYDAGNHIQAWE